jgi:hypothetical protein
VRIKSIACRAVLGVYRHYRALTLRYISALLFMHQYFVQLTFEIQKTVHVQLEGALKISGVLKSVLEIRSCIPDPDFFHPHIPNPYCQILDPTSSKKRRGEISCLTFFVAINITKLKIILFLNRYRKQYLSLLI